MTEANNGDRVQTLPPPHLVNVQVGAAWSVALPTVYRYEDQRWIDLFFETGALRLSTFAKFATYKDEVRGDSEEGKGGGYGETPDGKSIFVMAAEGMNAFVLSFSNRLDHALRTQFGRDSAFQIVNTLGFAVEVARQLPGFRGGLEGSCIYRPNTLIRTSVQFDIDKYKRPDGTMDMQMIFDAGAELGGAERILLKRLKYQTQQEYRLVWYVDAVKNEHVDISCPLARRYCRRVDANSYS